MAVSANFLHTQIQLGFSNKRWPWHPIERQYFDVLKNIAGISADLVTSLGCKLENERHTKVDAMLKITVSAAAQMAPRTLTPVP
jgi:hypothetical protein